jgi:lipopolysaccharide assembly protein A
MIRTFRYILLAVMAIMLLTIAMANRGPVTVRLLPDDLASFFGGSWALEMPLFLALLGGVVAGLLVGFVWEWIRESKYRGTASSKSREVARLERELAALRAATPNEEDDVIALLERKRV